ncbi:MAG: hypothetical protein A3G70_08200 [Planctomycetes bacterium RIFCSPLOWO2_12_FULL_39_13]|nr:MAG: hypothetical protein A3G70_08200 [Planctomycetes bacterium RIFCSPLOWO2_12_FULL_39_13]
MKIPDIIEIAYKVIKAFEKIGIVYHIGGSLASSAFGIPRATLDADIVADIKSEQVSEIEALLKGEFYISTEMIQNAIRYQSSFNLIHLETLFKVDVFILKHRSFDIQAFARRVQKTVSEHIPQKLFFSTPEDVILHKLEWYKEGGKVSDRQWSDIIGILRVQGSQLDIPYLDQWARELSVSTLLKQALVEAGLFGKQ